MAARRRRLPPARPVRPHRGGEFPSWTLKMQIMPFEDAKTYRFNPFDLTKVWPHGDYPLQRGRQADAEPQRHRLPRRDRAGRVRAEQHRRRAPACRRTRCCSPAGSATPTRTAPGSASTTSRSRSTRRTWRCTATPRTARCGSTTSATRSTRRTPTAARRPTRRSPTTAALVLRRRDGAHGLHAATRRRRLGPGRHAGARGARRRGPRAARRQHRRPPAQRRQRARAGAGVRVLAQRRQGSRRPHRAGVRAKA